MEDTDSIGVHHVFAEYGDYLIKESDTRENIREAVKLIEKVGRDIYPVLQKIHRVGGVRELEKIGLLAESKFSKIQDLYKELDTKIPEGTYWRYSQIWSNSNSWVCFLASLTIYLKTEQLPSMSQVSELLGLDAGLRSAHLDIEEYLLGLCHLSNELSRLAVNSVTSQDYSRPVRISEFLNSLHTGFRLLNLKNDNLRKRFDSIKYDVKKVEEVLYDLSIRGLAKPHDNAPDDVTMAPDDDVTKAADDDDKKEAAAAAEATPDTVEEAGVKADA